MRDSTTGLFVFSCYVYDNALYMLLGFAAMLFFNVISQRHLEQRIKFERNFEADKNVAPIPCRDFHRVL